MQKSLLKSKKGQLFIIEAFIAVSVMIIMVTAIYEVQLATDPPKEQDYGEIAYKILSSMDSSGKLDEFIQTIKFGSTSDLTLATDQITQTIYASLPGNGEFNFYCTNLTSGSIIEESKINLNLQSPSESVSVDYLITAVDGSYEPYSFHLRIWLRGV